METRLAMAFWKPGAERPASALDRDASAPVWVPSATPLPVHAARSRILYALEQYAVVVLVGETGSGKTTQVPPYLLDAGWAQGRQIVCTQPRRMAAVSVAAHVAQERQGVLGDEVGYAIRFDEQVHPTRTRLRYTTPGMLFRECMRDPLLHRYSVVMVDEAHERGAYTDLLLAVLKKIRRQRPALRIIVASATLEAEGLLRYLDPRGAASTVVTIQGRAYPVEVAHTPVAPRDVEAVCVQTVVTLHETAPPGDVLVFMSGQDKIERVVQALADRGVYAVPLYAALPPEEQRIALRPGPPGKRKVVVSTNVAETSVTIDGVRYVVDTGYTKLRYKHILSEVRLSAASAAQRAGRAGRTAPGQCLRLYGDSEALRTSDPPELVQCDLTMYVLQLKALGIDQIARFDFLPPAPPAAHVAEALAHLESLRALDDEGRLTLLGERMAEAPLSPMMARAILHDASCADEMLTIAAMTSVGSPFDDSDSVAAQVERRKFVAEEGDHLTLLNVYEAFQRAGGSSRWAAQHGLSYPTLKRARAIRAQLVTFVTRQWSWTWRRAGNEQAVRRCLAAGFFRQAVRYDGSWKTPAGDTLYVHPSSVLFTRAPPAGTWAVYGDLVHTTQPQMRDLCVVDAAWLLTLAPHYYHRSLH